MRKIAFLFAILATTSLFADKVKVGDLYYNLNSYDMTAEVTYEKMDIDNYAGLTSVEIPAAVSSGGMTYTITSVGEWAFYFANDLVSATIGNNVLTIKKRALSDCLSLQTIVIGDKVTTIEEMAFTGDTSLTTVTFGENLVNFPNSLLFGNCHKLTTVIWNTKEAPDFTYYITPFYRYDTGTHTTTNIGQQITSFTFGPNVKYVPACLCYCMTQLPSVSIPNSVDSIGQYAFCGCSSIKSVDIPNNLTKINIGVFGGSGLTSVTIPDNVTEIGISAFSGCEDLSTLKIGKKVREIRVYAFSDCFGLTSVTCTAVVPPYTDGDIFEQVDCSKIPLYVPAESVEAYQADHTKCWVNFNPILPIGSEGIENVDSGKSKVEGRKILRDGVLLIERGGKTYNAQGAEIK